MARTKIKTSTTWKGRTRLLARIAKWMRGRELDAEGQKLLAKLDEQAKRTRPPTITVEQAKEALKANGGKPVRAAKALGVTRQTLWRALNRK